MTSVNISRGLKARFRKILGKEWVLDSPADLICYSQDAGGYSAVPDLVLLPERAEQVAKILDICAQDGIPVVPRGAGTGTVGGSIPVQGGVVIAAVRMNRISMTSLVDLSCRVGPGVITGDLQNRISSEGLFYPPDPASLAFCTIGGNVATCAGGARAVKYGVTRDYVRAVQLALPDGSLLNLGAQTAKSVVGFDLARLVTGSEGCLGFITSITLRLLPMPLKVVTCVALYPTGADALDCVTGFFQASVVPRCAGFLDRLSLQAIRHLLPFPVDGDAAAMLLVELDGSEESAAFEANQVVDVMKAGRCLMARILEDQRAVEQVWQARRGMSPAIKRLGFSKKVSEDICVPRHALVEMLQFLESISTDDATILAFGHAGDGNLHVNLLLREGAAGDQELIRAVIGSIMSKAVELGGTISGEHGIGISKMEYLSLEQTAGLVDLQKRLKGLFDPRGIMNPGKIFL